MFSLPITKKSPWQRKTSECKDGRLKQSTSPRRTNDIPNKDWSLKDGEDFKKFQDDPGRSKPGKVCLKWWIRNECDSGFRKKKSHQVLSEHQTKEMNAFMKSMRNNK